MIFAWKQLVLLLLYSPTGQQRSSTPQCSSPTRSAIEPALLSAPCSVLSSHRPPQQRRRRWSHSGQLCSSPRSELLDPAERRKKDKSVKKSSSVLNLHQQRAALTTKTLPRKPGPVCSLSGACCLSDWRYMHIPVRKSLGWPMSIQKPAHTHTRGQIRDVTAGS